MTSGLPTTLNSEVTHAGTVFNVQRFSLHDGPGIRTTVFLKGCPLHCDWCHNPESQAGEPELAVLSNRCIGCGGCMAACEHGAVRLEGGVSVTDWDLCERCGECVEACPMAGRTLLGQQMTVADVLEEVKRDRDFHEESGGGVTFSGGEPLAQPGFLLACLQGCRQSGIHTCVDTCGHAKRSVLHKVAAWTDLFLYDIKIVDSELHRRFTGVPNEIILANLKWLCSHGSTVWLRMPLIPGVNDDSGNIEAVVRLIDSLAYRPPIQVLPYHAIGSHKYIRSGRTDPMGLTKPPEDARVHEIVERMFELGAAASLGG